MFFCKMLLHWCMWYIHMLQASPPLKLWKMKYKIWLQIPCTIWQKTMPTDKQNLMTLNTNTKISRSSNLNVSRANVPTHSTTCLTFVNPQLIWHAKPYPKIFNLIKNILKSKRNNSHGEIYYVSIVIIYIIFYIYWNTFLHNSCWDMIYYSRQAGPAKLTPLKPV